MKKLSILTLSALCVCALTTAAAQSTVSMTWISGDNPNGTKHLILGGILPGIYTFTNSVAYSQTSITLTNLQAGTWYYFVVQETDGMGDVSAFSNELRTKTKMNPASNLHLSP